MNSVSIALAVVGAIASIVGTMVMLKNLHSAPEGFEDTEGFHYGRPSHDLLVRTAVVRAGSYEHHPVA